MLFPSVPDSRCDFHEDKVLDRVGVEQTTCATIFYEYVWEFELEYPVNDDLLMFEPHMIYLDIFHDYTIVVPSFENSFLDFCIFDHLSNTCYASLSFDCREDKSFFPEPPNISSYIYRNIDGDISHFL